jgi:uncharacterized protein YcaQ
MTERTFSLTERYAALTDDELQNVAIEGGLADDARELLDQELRRRGIADLGEYKQYLRRVDQERLTEKHQALQRKEKSIRLHSRMGHGISIFGILAGLFALYIQKDEKNGAGIIIASAILLPLVWTLMQLSGQAFRRATGGSRADRPQASRPT